MMAGEKFTDQEVAYMVPMLLRDQIDHEAVCVIARDRIEALVRDRADLRAKLEALADTYAASATAAERRLREVVIAREAAEAENDKLRLLLAASKADCAYCGLPSDRMAECASGFPGCARADDMIADGTPTRAEMNDECDRLRAELADIKEDAAMSASSLANTLTNATEMLDDISALFPDDAPHKFGDTTGVSLLDDVRDLMTRAEAAETQSRIDRQLAETLEARALADAVKIAELEAALAEERRCRQDSDAKLMGHDDRLNAAAYELLAMRAKYEEVEARLAEERGRLDWIESDLPILLYRISGKVYAGTPEREGRTLRAAIDSALKGRGE